MYSSVYYILYAHVYYLLRYKLICSVYRIFTTLHIVLYPHCYHTLSYTPLYTPFQHPTNTLGQRASDFEEIALKRLEKIQALEAQLRQHVYALHQPGNTGIIMFIVLYVMYF